MDAAPAHETAGQTGNRAAADQYEPGNAAHMLQFFLFMNTQRCSRRLCNCSGVTIEEAAEYGARGSRRWVRA